MLDNECSCAHTQKNVDFFDRVNGSAAETDRVHPTSISCGKLTKRASKDGIGFCGFSSSLLSLVSTTVPQYFRGDGHR